MKILKVELINFGSYPSLSIDLRSLGLALIYGPTGAGKSTILDAIPWILYGVTSKNGGVDEVKSWQTAEESPTVGSAWVDTGTGIIGITRIRGRASKNDLYWIDGGNEHRGKDLADTQKLLSDRLGVSADTYLSGAYLHEFSPHGTFFHSNAKSKRQLFERIAPLGFAAKIGERASEARKAAKESLSDLEKSYAGVEARLSQITNSRDDAIVRHESWTKTKVEKVKKLSSQVNNFERIKLDTMRMVGNKAHTWKIEHGRVIDALVVELEAQERTLESDSVIQRQIDQLSDQSRCQQCQSLPSKATVAISQLERKKILNEVAQKNLQTGKNKLQKLIEEVNPYLADMDRAQKMTNEWKLGLEMARTEINPFEAQLVKIAQDLDSNTKDWALLGDQISIAGARISSLTQLYNLSFELRGQLLARAVAEIEASTNKILQDYFDGELRVGFSIQDSDSLEVFIQKSGYECVYTQLSKGQRQMLRLAFGVSIMKAVANTGGVHLDLLAFDEALDGFDSNLKVKAFTLFERLAQDHETILVIDHAPELQSLFETRFAVRMEEDKSVLARDP